MYQTVFLLPSFSPTFTGWYEKVKNMSGYQCVQPSPFTYYLMAFLIIKLLPHYLVYKIL